MPNGDTRYYIEYALERRDYGNPPLTGWTTSYPEIVPHDKDLWIAIHTIDKRGINKLKHINLSKLMR